MSEAERAEIKRNEVLAVWSFEAAERLAQGAKQSACATAAAELKALGEHKTGADFDRHNLAVYRAEVVYLETVIRRRRTSTVLSAARCLSPCRHGSGAEGKGKW